MSIALDTQTLFGGEDSTLIVEYRGSLCRLVPSRLSSYQTIRRAKHLLARLGRHPVNDPELVHEYARAFPVSVNPAQIIAVGTEPGPASCRDDTNTGVYAHTITYDVEPGVDRLRAQVSESWCDGSYHNCHTTYWLVMERVPR